ncbi:short-chain dehydrogenase/reductase SDR [Burkholderia sp. H160]|nr:short-chain dehydrogenase/reductase SDR [Burkholderia sp. H160]
MNISFNDKIVVVTGAASGLGRATAIEFARQGASLSLQDVNEKGLLETKASVEALGAACFSKVVDVSRKANCQAAIDTTVEHFGRLDVLCNVAGIVGFYHVTDITEAEWERTLGINLNGPFYLSQAAIPHLLQTAGNIVNVASVSGLRGAAHLVPYASSKAALVNMTRSMALEFMHKPIRINAIAPGAMDTTMGQGTAIPDGIDMSLVQRFFNMRAPSNPEEVARFIVYVASDQTPSIHGACLSVDTGVAAD